VARQDSPEVLSNSAQPRGPHISIGAAREIVHLAFSYRRREPRDSRGLEKRQIIKFVVLIVEHGVARHAGMLTKPRGNLVLPWLPRKIGRDIDEWDTPALRTEKSARIVTPGRRQYDLCPSPLQHRMKVRNQLWLSNVWKLPDLHGGPAFWIVFGTHISSGESRIGTRGLCPRALCLRLQVGAGILARRILLHPTLRLRRNWG
jgi:hypothetical protein